MGNFIHDLANSINRFGRKMLKQVFSNKAAIARTGMGHSWMDFQLIFATTEGIGDPKDQITSANFRSIRLKQTAPITKVAREIAAAAQSGITAGWPVFRKDQRKASSMLLRGLR